MYELAKSIQEAGQEAGIRPPRKHRKGIMRA
jgi:hypothetical protein